MPVPEALHVNALLGIGHDDEGVVHQNAGRLLGLGAAAAVIPDFAGLLVLLDEAAAAAQHIEAMDIRLDGDAIVEFVDDQAYVSDDDFDPIAHGMDPFAIGFGYESDEESSSSGGSGSSANDSVLSC